MGVQLYIEYDPRFPVVKNQLYQRLFRPLWNATLMCLLVLMYRSQNVDDIIVGYTKIFTDFSFSFSDILSGFNSSTAFYSMAGATMLLIPTIFFNRELKFKSNLLYLIVVFGLIMLIGQDARQQFLYFQF